MVGLSELTIEEKIKLVTGKGSWHTNDLGGKIPSIHLSDGPHGLRAQEEGKIFNNDSCLATCFPTASALACSFDREVLQKVALAISEEAKTQGVSIVLGPGVNMKRSPLCGRNFEYFSEDPYLAGVLGTEYIKTMEAEKIGTSLKHYAGNSQETHRMTMNAQIDERALREIYLAAFERCVKEGRPATIMASYNRVNGLHSCENKHLLTEILRDEWGYVGCVISDWGACVDLPACLHAGMDLEMPDNLGNHREDVLKALRNGSLTEEKLNEAVGYVLDMIRSYPTPKKKDNSSIRFPEVSGSEEENSNLIAKTNRLESGNGNLESEISSMLHYDVAKFAALNSAVLLKNDGILPLAKTTKVLVVGELAKKVRIQGGGSSHIHTGVVKDIIIALKEQGIDVAYAKGYAENTVQRNISLEKKALQQVRKAKNEGRMILFCGGLTNFTEGEGYDRDTFDMPHNQKILFDMIKEIDEDIIYVSFGGSPYDMQVAEKARAVLQMYLGGEGVSENFAELLLGMENPCGKLAETWPLSLEDIPCKGHFGRCADKIEDVEYRESIFVGYRYYDTFQIPVRFPFGYGMSYTTFEYGDLEVKHLSNSEKYVNDIPENKSLFRITCKVKNTGDRKGKEIVQLYVKNPATGLLRANKELRGFQKVSLEPGETKEVSFVLKNRDFSIFDVSRDQFVCVNGKYEIQVASNINDSKLRETVSVTGVTSDQLEQEIYHGVSKDMIPSYFPKDKERFSPSGEDFIKLYGKELSDFTNTKPGEYSFKNSLRQLSETSGQAKRLFQFCKFVARVLTITKRKEDPEVMMMVEGICDGNIDTVINQSGGIIKRKSIQKMIKKANRTSNDKRVI